MTDEEATAPVEFVEEGALKRDLGLFSLVALIVGSMIGSGIFFLPGAMLKTLGTTDAAGVTHIVGGAGPVMAAWVVGAVIALCGGLMFAELGGAFPKVGGQYAFLRDATGKLPAFMFSWTAFAVVQSGTIAAVAVAFANTLDRRLIPSGSLPDTLPGHGLPGHEVPLGFVKIPSYGVALVALLVMGLLTYVNYRGVKRGAWVSNFSTVAKVAALVFVALASFGLAKDVGSFSGTGLSFSGFTLAAFGAAAASSLFAYDGFAQATFVAGEVKDARRVLPKAIIIATLLVGAIYLTAVFAFFHAVNPQDASQAILESSDSIGMSTAAVAMGAWAAVVLAVFIAISTFGTVNAYVLSSPRIYHAVAKDREFPRPFGHLSRFGTPTYGLVYGLVWAGFLTLTGSFDALADLVVFGLYVFYLITVVAYFILRRRHPEEIRPFRIPLSPLPAVVFGIASVGVLLSFFVKDLGALATGNIAGFMGSTTGLGIILILLGLGLYWGQQQGNARRARFAVDPLERD